jgi:Mrp family chromosome partitioning ATPase
MTRIFDALKKAQTPIVAPVTPKPGPAVPPLPIVTPGTAPPPMTPTRSTHALTALPRIEVIQVPALDEQDMRELATLRIGLDSALASGGGRMVMFSASQRGEGTSTVARRFAALLAAEGGRRVLLADLHGRRPALSQWMDREIAHPAPGASELSVLPLAADVRARGAMTATAARPLLEALGQAFEWVVLDGPPVLGAPESVELAALADGVVLVVQSGSAKRPVVSRAASLLRAGGARVLGTVLNRRRHEIPEFIYRRI